VFTGKETTTTSESKGRVKREEEKEKRDCSEGLCMVPERDA
jgi:hypothetical protein